MWLSGWSSSSLLPAVRLTAQRSLCAAVQIERPVWRTPSPASHIVPGALLLLTILFPEYLLILLCNHQGAFDVFVLQVRVALVCSGNRGGQQLLRFRVVLVFGGR